MDVEENFVANMGTDFVPNVEGIKVHLDAEPKSITPLMLPRLPGTSGEPENFNAVEGNDFSDVVWEKLEDADFLFTLAGGKNVPSYLTVELFEKD